MQYKNTRSHGLRRSLGVALVIVCAALAAPSPASAWNFAHCTTAQQSIINKSATKAVAWLNTERPSNLFFRWFPVPAFNYQGVYEGLYMIAYYKAYALESLSSIGIAARQYTPGPVIFDCAARSNSIAAQILGTRTVVLNGPFWTLTDSTDPSTHMSRPATMIHEITHLAGTRHWDEELGAGIRDPYAGADWLADNGYWRYAFSNAASLEFYFSGVW